MFFSDKIVLVATSNHRDGLGQLQSDETGYRSVWADVSSVSMAEAASAGASGITPSIRATIHTDDYQGETIVRYGGSAYAVYRSYHNGGDRIELYLEKKAGVA